MAIVMTMMICPVMAIIMTPVIGSGMMPPVMSITMPVIGSGMICPVMTMVIIMAVMIIMVVGIAPRLCGTGDTKAQNHGGRQTGQNHFDFFHLASPSVQFYK